MSVKESKHQVQICLHRDFGTVKQEFKTAIDILWDLIGKVDNRQEQMGTISKKRKIL